LPDSKIAESEVEKFIVVTLMERRSVMPTRCIPQKEDWQRSFISFGEEGSCARSFVHSQRRTERVSGKEASGARVSQMPQNLKSHVEFGWGELEACL
jgi:hypothetical protein